MAALLCDVELLCEYAKQNTAFGNAITDPQAKQRLLAMAARQQSVR